METLLHSTMRIINGNSIDKNLKLIERKIHWYLNDWNLATPFTRKMISCCRTDEKENAFPPIIFLKKKRDAHRKKQYWQFQCIFLSSFIFFFNFQLPKTFYSFCCCSVQFFPLFIFHLKNNIINEKFNGNYNLFFCTKKTKEN